MVTSDNALLLPLGWTVKPVDLQTNVVIYHATPPETKPVCADTLCSAYGTSLAMKRHDARARRIIDAPVHGKPAIIVVRVARYRCKCGMQANQPLHDIHDKYSMTIRCVEYIQRESLRRSFMSVARDCGIDDARVRYISNGHVADSGILEPQSEDFVRVMGIDDVYLRGIRRTVVMNLEKKRPIELLAGQKKGEVIGYLSQLTNKEGIEIVCMDMASHFVTSVKEAFQGNFTTNRPLIVFDKWHVVRQALDAMNESRKQCQRHIRAIAAKDKRKGELADIKIKDLKKHYTLFLRRRFHQFGLGLEDTLLNYFELWPSLRAAYDLKEKFCDIWAALNKEDAEHRMNNWLLAHDKEIVRYKKDLANAKRRHRVNKRRRAFVHVEADPGLIFAGARSSITRNREFVLNYFDPRNIGAEGKRFTNAGTEAANGLIKEVNRGGRGYSFKNLRARVLLREAYSPVVRKTQKVKRARNPSKIINPFKTVSGPVLKSNVFVVDDVLKTTCASATCKTNVTLPVIKRSIDPDTYDISHKFRFCGPCFDARVAYVNSAHDEIFRYAQQAKLVL